MRAMRTEKTASIAISMRLRAKVVRRRMRRSLTSRSTRSGGRNTVRRSKGRPDRDLKRGQTTMMRTMTMRTTMMMMMLSMMMKTLKMRRRTTKMHDLRI